jgi:hypothetical protein
MIASGGLATRMKRDDFATPAAPQIDDRDGAFLPANKDRNRYCLLALVRTAGGAYPNEVAIKPKFHVLDERDTGHNITPRWLGSEQAESKQRDNRARSTVRRIQCFGNILVTGDEQRQRHREFIGSPVRGGVHMRDAVGDADFERGGEQYPVRHGVSFAGVDAGLVGVAA